MSDRRGTLTTLSLNKNSRPCTFSRGFFLLPALLRCYRRCRAPFFLAQEIRNHHHHRRRRRDHNPCHARRKLANRNDVHVGGRTAWQGTVRVGTYHVIKARYWYNGHYNAYEDAAELMLNIFEKRSNGEQQSPTSPQTSPQTARPYFGSDEFSNYTTTAGSSSEAAVRAGGGVGVGVGVGSIGGNGSYTYGSIGDAVVGQGLGGGLRHTHSHSLAHGSQARGAASFVSNYGG